MTFFENWHTAELEKIHIFGFLCLFAFQFNKKFKLMLTRRTEVCNSSGSVV